MSMCNYKGVLYPFTRKFSNETHPTKAQGGQLCSDKVLLADFQTIINGDKVR